MSKPQRDVNGRFIKGHKTNLGRHFPSQEINKFWSLEQVNFLKQHYATMDNNELTKTFKKNISAIRGKANSMGLRKLIIHRNFANSRLGLSYEQQYGEEKAKVVKQKLSDNAFWRGKKQPLELRLKKSLKTKGTRTGAQNPATRPEVRKKIAQTLKNGASSFYKFKDHPEWRRKNLESCIKKPSGAEKKLLSLIGKYGYPFNYTGDGKFLIGSLNPDFLHQSEKKVIEVFGRVFHDPSISFKESIPWHQQYFGRMAYYSQKGYECLIIWDKELKNEDAVALRINSFLETSR